MHGGSRRRSAVLTPSWPTAVDYPNVARRGEGVPQPLIGIVTQSTTTPWKQSSRRAPGAALHFAVESSRLGGDEKDQENFSTSPPSRFVADGRRSLRAPGLFRSSEKSRPSILKQCTREDASWSCNRSPSLLHDRLARRMVSSPQRSEPASVAIKRILHLARPELRATAGETALLWGEDVVKTMVARLRENRDFCLAAMKKCPVSRRPRRWGVLPFSEDRRHDRLILLLQGPVNGNPRRPRSRSRIWGGRRR